MTKEIVIRVAAVSPELTAAASEMICRKFGGAFRTDGFGCRVLKSLQAVIEVPSVAWQIGTAAKDSERYEFISAFAAAYCKAGNQEAIYFLDSDGLAYSVLANGRIDPLD